MMVEMAASNTLIQSMVPDRLRGRVMAVYSMMFMGMAPFGALLAGRAGRHARGAGDGRRRRARPASPAPPSSRCGCRHWRAEGPRLIVAQEAAGGEPPEERTGGAVA